MPRKVPDDTQSDISNETLRLLSQKFAPPSSLPPSSHTPLVVLSPSELQSKLTKQQQADSEEEEDKPLWEELLDDLLYTIPFGFLYAAMDYAVHAQYGQELPLLYELRRLLDVIPALYLLTFLSSRPPSRALLPPLYLQGLFFLLSLVSGSTMIDLVNTAPYLKVMLMTPALGVLWIWTVVRLELGAAVVALVIVGVVTAVRGQAASLIGR